MKTFSWLLAAVLSASVFVLFFSTTTSPLYDYGAMFDSAMFQVIGRGWAEGVLPYTGLWDSKGPMIFFINALGYVLTGTSFGVCILQIVSLSAAMCVVFKWLSLAYSPRGALLLGLVVLAGLSLNYDFGNLTEEYLLPLLFAAYYLMYKWTLRASVGVYAHPAKYALVYGMVLGFSLMTRVTNAVGVCTGVLFILFFLVRTRLWKNILHNFLWFIAGFAVIVVPFVVYFGAHGMLDEMWYGTVGYNISYAGHASSRYTLDAFVLASRNYFYCVLAIAAGAFSIRGGKRLAGAFWLTSAFVTFAYLNFTYRIPHYGMVALPYLCAVPIFSRSVVGKVAPRLLSATTVAAALTAFFYMVFVMYGVNFKNESGRMLPMVKDIPALERDSFIGYNCDAGIYIWAGMTPACRYFSFQDWAVGNDERLTGKLLAEYSRLKAKWILFEGDAYDTEIGGIVRRHYRLVKEDKTNGYSLFRLKEKGLTGNVED